MSLRIKTIRGFTLVETIVYAAGLLIILGGLTIFMFYLYSWYRSATVPTRTDGAALALMNQITTDLRVANSLIDAESQYSTANGWVTMKTSSGANSTTTTYYLESGHIKSKAGTAATTTISAGDMWVSGFYLKKLTTPNSTAVHVEIDMDYSIKGATTTNVYSDLAILRQSY